MSRIKKIIIILFLVSIYSSNLYSEERSYQEIKNVAINWAIYNNHDIDYRVDSSSINPLIYNQLNNISAIKKYYYIIKLKPKGWVIVSSDDIAKPIIGYSFKSNLGKVLPLQFVNWLKGVNKDIKNAIDSGIVDDKYLNTWNMFSIDPEAFKANLANYKLYTTIQVNPLLDVTWSQGRYYNDMCPIDKTSSAGNNRVYVGCVATAMAQIMKYHSWPDKGIRNHSYTHSKYGKISANFNTTYNWNNMPNYLSNKSIDVAKISFHAGVAVDMYYGPDGSGAYPLDADKALKKYFKYTTIGLKWKDDMGLNTWHSLLKNDLDNKLPVFYASYDDNGNGGHAFVCDGYKYISNNKYYHFNWGWNGYANGWFAIGALNPVYFKFNTWDNAIFRIKPNGKSKQFNIAPILYILLQS